MTPYKALFLDADNTASVNLGVIVGSTCGGVAALIIIATIAILLWKHMSRYVKLAESWRPDPFPATSTLPHEQIVSLAVQPRTNEKTRMRLASRDAAVYQPGRQSDANFDIFSTTGDTRRAEDAAPGSSTTNPYSHDVVIDCRPENTSPPTAPPSYHTGSLDRF